MRDLKQIIWKSIRKPPYLAPLHWYIQLTLQSYLPNSPIKPYQLNCFNLNRLLSLSQRAYQPPRHYIRITPLNISSCRYAKVHKLPQGFGDPRPTGLDIVKDESLEGKPSDQRSSLITGCSSGLGFEAVRALSATGFLGVRDIAKGESALADTLGQGRVELLKIDLLDRVREGAQTFWQKSKALNVLINNAGVMATPKGKTADGASGPDSTPSSFQFLKSTLLASSTPNFNSRFVALSSIGHRIFGILTYDYNFQHPEYNPWVAYGQSKDGKYLHGQWRLAAEPRSRTSPEKFSACFMKGKRRNSGLKS